MSRENAYKATVDFETRSACSLKLCGAWKYSLDPSTEVLCLVFRLPYWPAGVTSLWTPPFPALGIAENFHGENLLELCDWIAQGELVEAHSAFFERAIWTNILSPKYGFPLVPQSSWRCSAAKAAACALPRKLEDAGDALHLTILKDTEGGKVMKKVSKPRKPRKKERETWAATHGSQPHPVVYFEDSSLFGTLWAYCQQDVLAEEALSHHLPDLDPMETEYYLLDQRMNERGFKLDLEAVEIALSLIASETTLLNRELEQITSGQVTRATQRDRMKAWLKTQGVDLFDTKGTTIDDALACDNSPDEPDFIPFGMATVSGPARRALEILRTLGRSSTAKYETMRQWACPDGRVRGGLLYHGATTGRWSGAGVQPHNFPKGTIKSFDMEAAWTIIKTGDRAAILAAYPKASVMEVLACALRGALVAAKGHQLYVADYASIEARVLLWLAREEKGLRLFREGGNLYLDMAAAIYGRSISKEDKIEYPVGKFSILGLGYGMGAGKFKATCAGFGVELEDEFAEEVVTTYRAKYHRVKSLWYDTEDAALEAMRCKGKVVKQDRLAWQRVDGFLYCTLPSGRRLAYPEPEVRERETPWGAMKPALTFMGVNPLNHAWQRQHTYGGSLVENIVQAISRDLMAAALLRCEQGGVYTPILSVHDEVIAEAKLGTGDVKEFEALLTKCPLWATGCPLGAEGWKGQRYHK